MPPDARQRRIVVSLNRSRQITAVRPPVAKAGPFLSRCGTAGFGRLTQSPRGPKIVDSDPYDTFALTPNRERGIIAPATNTKTEARKYPRATATMLDA
jgi:hypothetical protein